VNELDGYAIGNDNILLMTVDAGTNWTEMNMFSDGTTGTDVELNCGTITGSAPDQGATVTGGTSGATGVVVSYDDWNDYMVLTTVTGTFAAAENLTWTAPAAGNASITSVDTTTWRYNFGSGNCIQAVQNSGTAPTGVTIWFANPTSETYEGIWKISGSAVAAGAARTYTWTTPTVAFQESSVIGDVSYDDIVRFFFFDQMTGVAAREDYGILTTIDGGTTWTHQTVTEITGFNEYWSEFWYINNGATGWLYSLENDGYFARVGIDYSAAGTPPYTFSATSTYAVLTASGTNNSAEVDEHTGAVLHNNQVFAIAQSWGDWTHGSSIGNATFDDDKYSDPSDVNVGGVAANGSNPMYDKEIKINTTTYYLEHWCQR
jgi:hypothetical protein